MLGGRIVLLGNVGERTGESMYGGMIFYRRGAVASIGTNIRSRALEPADIEALTTLFVENNLQGDPGEFECLVPRPGKQTYHLFKPEFTARERA
jgi:formylmethanofuran dehydrogenase subunit C